MGKGSVFEVGHNVELELFLLHLSAVVAFIVILEFFLHKLEHKLKRYPKYHEMMTKVFGELMILGFIGLAIKVLKELADLNAYSKSMIAFQAADLAVFIMAVALILQSICVFMRLRVQNILWDKAELIGSQELLTTIQAHSESMKKGKTPKARDSRSLRDSVRGAANPARRRVQPKHYYDLVQMRLIRHFFLKKVGLPELFPFAKYLRQAQENQISHMLEVDVSMWIVLIIIGWVLHEVADFFEYQENLTESESIVPAFLVFAWGSALLQFAIHQYFSWAIRQVLFAACRFTGRSNWLVCLEEVAMHEIKSVNGEMASNAIEAMENIREAEAAKKSKKHHNIFTHHDKGFRLVSLIARNLKRRLSKAKTEEPAEASKGDPSVWIKWFSRQVWHFIVVSSLMFNAFYIALFIQCLGYQLSHISHMYGKVTLVALVLPLLLKMFFFQPRIMWGYTLVSSVVRVDLAALSDVIDHFSETVQLRSQLTETILDHLKANGQTIETVREALQALDPDHTGFIEADQMREFLNKFGVRLSFFGFNSVARLIFDFKGTSVPYRQLLCLLELGSTPTNDGVVDVQAGAHPTLNPLGVSGISHFGASGIDPLGASAVGGIHGLLQDEPVSPISELRLRRVDLSQSSRGVKLTSNRTSMFHLASHRMAMSMYRLDFQDDAIDENAPRSTRHPKPSTQAHGFDHAEFEDLLKNIRSKLVSDTCEHLARIVRVMRHAFRPLANLLVIALANTAKGSSIAIREPGAKLFSAISEYSRYDLTLFLKAFRLGQQERVRALVLAQMQVVFAYWTKDEVEPAYGEMVDTLRRGLKDPAGAVRTAARQAFCAFSDLWSERLDELVEIPPATIRELLVKEKPHAAITKAIKKKYYGATRERSDSAKDIRLRRAVFRKQTSSQAEGDDPIFVEVKDSPRRPQPVRRVSEAARRLLDPVQPIKPLEDDDQDDLNSLADEYQPARRASEAARRLLDPVQPIVPREDKGEDFMGNLANGVQPVRRTSEAVRNVFDPVESIEPTDVEDQENMNGIANGFPPAENIQPKSGKRVTIVDHREASDVFEPPHFDVESTRSTPRQSVFNFDHESLDINHQPQYRLSQDFSDSRPDAFLDRPIPSSERTPTPRSAANVTVRQRRRVLQPTAIEESVPSISDPVPSEGNLETFSSQPPEEFSFPVGQYLCPTEQIMLNPSSTHFELPEDSQDDIDETIFIPRVSVPSTVDREFVGLTPGATETAQDSPSKALLDLKQVMGRLKEIREQSEAQKVSEKTSKPGSFEEEHRGFASDDVHHGACEESKGTVVSRQPSVHTQEPVVDEKTFHKPYNFGMDASPALDHPAVDSHRELRTRQPVTSPNPREEADRFVQSLSIGTESEKVKPDFVRVQDTEPVSTQRRRALMPAHPVRARPSLTKRSQPPATTVPAKEHHPAQIANNNRQTTARDPRTEVQVAENQELKPIVRSVEVRGGDRLPNTDARASTANGQIDREKSNVKRSTILKPEPHRAKRGVANKIVLSFCVMLSAVFGVAGLIQASSKVRDAYDYHHALMTRMNDFESSVVESYDSVRKMDEKYAIWSEYVRELAEQDEANAVQQLENIQQEVEKWQVEMKNDLLAFKRSLSGDIIDAAFAPLRRENATTNEP
ncbi:hypothetical protein Poli38472_000951 [Pythium oligandrum]|uniref:EF-hand domain-containing protein n=1 Tax=Pythium oligandrum TaxID=41045 RepID=A0A8K1CCL8_PYTOL|nr:hypothetical protein Poli38472_000951 [Pythium oligandrum]|eukprot:TMW60909.1 hypothetical protein Poli38472_000951 [Pythium oligandrum]